MFSLIPSSSQPFGPFQPFHDYVLSNSYQTSLLEDQFFSLTPAILTYLQCLLLQSKGTRPYRLTLGFISIGCYMYAFTYFRVPANGISMVNYIRNIVYMNSSIRCLEYGLIVDPVRSKFAKGRSRCFEALDINLSIRWIGLRPIEVYPKDVSRKNKHGSSVNGDMRNGLVKSGTRNHQNNNDNDNEIYDKLAKKSMNGTAISDTTEHWVIRIENETKWELVQRRLRRFLVCWIYSSVVIKVAQQLGAKTIALPIPPPNAAETFFLQTFVLFPNSAIEMKLHKVLVNIIFKVLVGGLVYQMLDMGYEVFSAIVVALGIWDKEAWDAELFGDPMGADSILKFWSESWHQMVRHTAVLTSLSASRLLGLPAKNPLMVIFPFVFSGVMHGLGQIGSPYYASPSKFAGFFVISGFGCLAELFYKRLSGRKVHGWPGWIWKTAFLLITSEEAMKSILNAGYGAMTLPDFGLGDLVAGWITRYLVNVQ